MSLDSTILALDQAAGAGAVSLALYRYFKLDEAAGVNAADSGPLAADPGTYVNAPTLAAEGMIHGEANGGNAVQLNGTDEYVDLGTLDDWASKITDGGVTVVVWFRAATEGNTGTILGGVDSAGVNGIHVELRTAVFDGDTIRVRVWDSAGTVLTGTFASSDAWFSHGGPMMLRIRITASTVRLWVWENELTGTVTGTLATVDSMGQPVMVGALGTAGTPGTYLAGIVQRLALFSGELTDAQGYAVAQAATYTFYGVPGCIAHLRAGTDTCYTDTARTTAAGEGDQVAGVEDLAGDDSAYGGGFHLAQATAANRPTLQTAPDGAYELDFDNWAQGEGTPRRQAMTAQSALWQATRYGVIAVYRLSYNGDDHIHQLFAVGADASAPALGACVYSDKAALNHSGIKEPTDAAFPVARCAPGVGVTGWSAGLTLAGGDGKVYQGSASSATGSMATGAFWDPTTAAMQVGGNAAANGNLFIGRVRELAVFLRPFSATEWASARARIEAAHGVSTPRWCAVIAGDSISCMNNSTLNLGWQNRLPREAMRGAWTNPSRPGAELDDDTNPSMADRTPGLETAVWWDADASVRVGVIAAITNDAAPVRANTFEDIQADYQALRDDLIAAGATHILVVVPGQADATLKDQYLAWLAANPSLYDRLVHTTAAGDVHPTNAEFAVMADEVWTEGLEPLVVAQGGSRTRAYRSRSWR